MSGEWEVLMLEAEIYSGSDTVVGLAFYILRFFRKRETEAEEEGGRGGGRMGVIYIRCCGYLDGYFVSRGAGIRAT